MKIMIVAAALLTAGAAVPALAQGGPPDPYGDATVSKADAEAQASARFAELDTNHDNSLSPEERAAGRGPGGGGGFGGGGPGGPGGPGAQGPMSKDDYIAAQVRRFEMQDGDHDGQLTKAERDAFRQQMIQRFQNGGGAPGGSL